ncbi:hypothetical protein AALP_AA7G055000 [Arabis alpina]|uniref:Reverse transcriptase domain-containing protein n=1 Tax=Arabis alpina TaxID=50452 RepID=A0A087GG32_ARAAL|nr:hypothetical protein AALP_AA7G055000 [Arabis alpina]
MPKKKKKSPQKRSPAHSPSVSILPQPSLLDSPNLMEEPHSSLPMSVAAMPPAVCDSQPQVTHDSEDTAMSQAATAPLSHTISDSVSPTKPLAVGPTPSTEPPSLEGLNAPQTSGSSSQVPGASPIPRLVAKTTWSELVQGTLTKMKKRGTPFVLESGELCVEIPNDVIKRNLKRWDSFILGQFHGNLPSHGALHAIFNRIWSNKLRDITVSKLGHKSVLIRVPSPATRKRILSQALWHIEGQTMFVASYSPGLTPAMPSLEEVPVWLEFKGVPPHFYSEEGLEYIISKSAQIVSCLVELPHSAKEMVISFVYAFNTKEQRRVLWEEIEHLGTSSLVGPRPWAILGDFNQTLNPSDSSKGGSRITRGIEEFRQCLLQAGVSDLTFRGNTHTWWNKQIGDPITKKLDRILVNDNWKLQFQFSYGFFGVPEFSDHCPSCIYTGTSRPPKRHFMVSHFLMDHKDFLSTVKDHWDCLEIRGTRMFKVSKKLKSLKAVIKDLNRQHYSGIEQRVTEALSHLSHCQEQVLLNNSPASFSDEKEAYENWMMLSKAEEKFLFQRSRVKSISLGDCCSGYFHRIASSRRSANHIPYLRTTYWSKTSSEQDIQNHCVDFFTGLFGTSALELSNSETQEVRNHWKFRCSPQARELLSKHVSAEKIMSEIAALPLNKTPGPDGFTGEFFRKSWDIVGEDITAAVSEFFTSGRILKQWNSTAVSLIPKRQGADMVSEFRPISLCNVLYKVISKILARRLQQVMSDMIAPSQYAFVKGRLLVENVLLASELVQGFNKKSVSARGLLKVDLRKAFDSVNWEFILLLLKIGEFPEVLNGWIEQCITTTSFSINVNGELCGYFKGKRGLRQGDPISPYLFVMAMEVLANMLHMKFSEEQIGYHPLCKNLHISHLSFADDIMIFYDGTAASLASIVQVLKDFENLSGLSVNSGKTERFNAGIGPEEKEKLQLFGFAEAFLLPKGCIKEIEKLCSRFLWGNNIDKRAAAKSSPPQEDQLLGC